MKRKTYSDFIDSLSEFLEKNSDAVRPSFVASFMVATVQRFSESDSPRLSSLGRYFMDIATNIAFPIIAVHEISDYLAVRGTSTQVATKQGDPIPFVMYELFDNQNVFRTNCQLLLPRGMFREANGLNVFAHMAGAFSVIADISNDFIEYKGGEYFQRPDNSHVTLDAESIQKRRFATLYDAANDYLREHSDQELLVNDFINKLPDIAIGGYFALPKEEKYMKIPYEGMRKIQFN